MKNPTCMAKPLRLPELPLAGRKHIDAKTKVGDSMRENALRDAFGAVEQEIIGKPSEDSGNDQVVFQAKENRTYDKRRPGKETDGDRVKLLVGDIANEKGSPEELFHNGHNHDSSEQPDGDAQGSCHIPLQEGRVKTLSFCPKRVVHVDPHDEHENSRC